MRTACEKIKNQRDALHRRPTFGPNVMPSERLWMAPVFWFGARVSTIGAKAVPTLDFLGQYFHVNSRGCIATKYVHSIK